MPDQPNRGNTSFSYQEGILLIVGFVVVSVVFAGFVGLVNAYAVSIALPMLSIAGIVLLLLCLAGISYVFVRTELQDKTQALGLPAGSIQAVIALSLIVLFAILSIFLFTSMGPTIRSLTVGTPAERDAQVTQLGSMFAGWEQTRDGKFTIFVRDPPSDTRDDVGKQLIVLIGTLMTSAVSFYFGSRATVAGAAATNPDTKGLGTAGAATSPNKNEQSTSDQRAEDAPVITTIEPVDGIRKGQSTQVTIIGTGLSRATAVAFKQGEEVLEVASFTSTDTRLVCTVNPSSTSFSGTYDVILTVAGMEVSKPAGLKVIE